MKYLKVIIVNILLLILVFFLSDYLFVRKLVYHQKQAYPLRKYIFSRWFYQNTYLDDIYIYNRETKNIKHLNERRYRTPLNVQDKNSPILIFGCSFAYGYRLSPDKNFSGQLAKYLQKETIVNRALVSHSVQLMLYQLENPLFYNLYPKSKLIIYVYIPDHIRRLYVGVSTDSFTKDDILYEMKAGRLQLKKGYKLYCRAYLINLMYKHLVSKIEEKTKREFLIEHFKAASIAIRSHYGNIPFIVLNYSYEPMDLPDEIDVISLKDLSDKNFLAKEYRVSENDEHPNAKAWQEITPLFIDILKQRGYIK